MKVGSATGSYKFKLPSANSVNKSYVWFYTLDLRIEMQSADLAYVSPSNFSDIFLSRHCMDIQNRQLQWTKIHSFSISTYISSLFLVDNVRYTPIVGFISSTRQIFYCVVHDWLTHPNITNLQLTPIANRHEHPMIKAFLSESALHDPCALGSGDQPQPAIRGRRLRVDMDDDCALIKSNKPSYIWPFKS